MFLVDCFFNTHNILSIAHDIGQVLCFRIQIMINFTRFDILIEVFNTSLIEKKSFLCLLETFVFSSIMMLYIYNHFKEI